MDMFMTPYILLMFFGVCGGRRFIEPKGNFDGCIGGSVDLKWIVQNFSETLSIIWMKHTPYDEDILKYTSTGINISASYIARVEYIANSTLRLKNVNPSDEGTYSCSVTFQSYPPISDMATLHLYNTVTRNLSCEFEGKINCSVPDTSIQRNTKVLSGGSFYNICMIGGASMCLASDVVPCIMIQGTAGQKENDSEKQNVIIFSFLLPLIIVLLIVIIVLYGFIWRRGIRQ